MRLDIEIRLLLLKARAVNVILAARTPVAQTKESKNFGKMGGGGALILDFKLPWILREFNL